MCLLEVGDLGHEAFSITGSLARAPSIDLEPLTLAGETTVVSGILVAMRLVPMCPGFRQITVRRPDGSGHDVVVALSTLLYVHCTESELPR